MKKSLFITTALLSLILIVSCNNTNDSKTSADQGSTSQVQTIKTNQEKLAAILDAIKKGDMAFIKNNISEKFVWSDPSDTAIVPYGGMSTGRDAYIKHLQLLRSNLKINLLEVDKYVSEDNNVVILGRSDYSVPATGKSVSVEWSQIWTFEKGVPVTGKIYIDTDKIAKAFSKATK